MKTLIAAATAAGLIAISVLSGASLALAADQPAPAPAPAPAAPSQGVAGPEDWFPGFLAVCKKQGLTDADCQKQYNERKQLVLGICAKQNITGEEACRKWVGQRREAAMGQRRAFCKENGVTGSDQDCAKFISQKQAEVIADFKAQCQKDGLTEDQCKDRFEQRVQQAQAQRQLVEDCKSKGGSEEDCVAKLRSSQGGDQGGAGSSGHMAAPAQPDKGSALPPPTK